MKTTYAFLISIIAVFIFSVLPNDIFGQNESPKMDTTKLRFGNYKFFIIEDESSPSDHKLEYTAEADSLDDDDDEDAHQNHWAGIDIGVNGYLTADNNTSLPSDMDYLALDYGRSITWSLNPIEKNFSLYQNHIGLVTGLGFEFNKYQFKNNITLNETNDTLFSVSNAIKYKKNALHATYLTVPLLLEFNTNNNNEKSFHVAVGLVGAYKIGSKLKQVFKNDETKLVNKYKGDYNIAPFKYSAMARVGYGKYSIFASYALSDLFDDKNIGALHPFTAGITLVGF